MILLYIEYLIESFFNIVVIFFKELFIREDGDVMMKVFLLSLKRFLFFKILFFLNMIFVGKKNLFIFKVFFIVLYYLCFKINYSIYFVLKMYKRLFL